MHRIAALVFWVTLILFGAVLIFASYVGVYLTYVAIPVIVVSGVIMRITEPKKPRVQGPIGRFVMELRGLVAKEVSDAKEMLNREADYLEKIRMERGDKKAPVINGADSLIVKSSVKESRE